jgi:hypothetical protein
MQKVSKLKLQDKALMLKVMEQKQEVMIKMVNI